MNLARVSANGQITVPVEIRRLLKLEPGDKVLFIQRANGEVVVANAAQSALAVAQQSFAGAALDLEVESDDDVQGIVDELRLRSRTS
jgi:AbrB family looped-hinge helix DNA binding protein